jgi:hypothetical protein
MERLEGFLWILTGITGIAAVVWSMLDNSIMPFAVWCGILALGITWHEEKHGDKMH